ncbi:Adaptive-response sensory-kinase SasA [Candidatus Lokiarchaeum ossiferum]|uniref:Adaptive-response sensory-kinase SasA n=1 Tax=Candidatus Lokiarchaeum ossiferum TaxID=2951803 RepID=A0ABY6HQM4_9ARCH|nr:Adaptive-response sensory-kinase SasA [Candidatus Lokiarchaeum sp. B-35]
MLNPMVSECHNSRDISDKSLSLLVGGIAHDLNNILTMITGTLSMNLLDLDQPSDLKNDLENALFAANKASTLTNQLLQFSKGGDPIKKNASIEDIVLDSTNFILSGSRIKVIYSIPQKISEISCDPNQISQVVQNIVLNARQAITESGIIKVSIRELNNFKPHNAKSNITRWIKLTFKDNGPGIPESILNDIFTPYFTTKADGNGLGLATAYEIIQKHDGYIYIDSQEGMGAEFSIYLPI